MARTQVRVPLLAGIFEEFGEWVQARWSRAFRMRTVGRA